MKTRVVCISVGVPEAQRVLVVGTQDQEYVNNMLRNNDINPEDYEIEYKFY